MVAHCSEAYWTNLIRKNATRVYDNVYPCIENDHLMMRDYMQRAICKRYEDASLDALSNSAFFSGKSYFSAVWNEETGQYEKTDVLTYHYEADFNIPADIFEDYVNGRFVKTVCEAKNRAHLMKVVDKALDMGLKLDADFGIINDACFTELTPENSDGTCTVGVWFAPLEDEKAHELSKKYQLYRE